MKPNTEGKALGLTVRDGNTLRDQLARLESTQRGLDALDGIVEGVTPLCQECGQLRGAVREVLNRFYSTGEGE